MLEVSGLQASYGAGQVLFGVDLRVGEGEVVTLLGRNGMGKTTTVNAIMGLLAPKAGRVAFCGRELTGRPAHEAARAGLGLVPEGRQIFPNLTVRENLVATADGRGAWTLSRVFDLFPRLRERQDQMGGSLSGGEQQMLAIGRALMTNPRLLLLDEATEGLAPLIRKEIWQVLLSLKRAGQSILVIDKNLKALKRIADRHYVLEKGRIVWQGSGAELEAERERLERHLGV
ncbi:ABC transporter ATP-binding protein [Azospirillum sp. TSO22-1]|uniref:ABC transporter ATP-binding protein n=1 Tax=Azospirillum sp. TSO22-1 TaxID=716789 RepID=UPI000D60B916|nr:ABC transporter ATP-binding protein [Azospirillum sp. TSO22-1]PWC37270.1 ABC transporter ATP-binding protein [Azospirillum sp. TSO22-1]